MAASQEHLVQSSALVPKVRTIAFNRPGKRNALSQGLITEFLRELSAATRDPDVNVIVVYGNQSCFSAGADIKEIQRLDAAAARECRYLEDLCNGMEGVRKPLVAAVEGIALGGGFEVALMCDLIIASSQAQFGLPEVKIGLLPGAGGTQRLTNAVGKFQAMKMILLGSSIGAQEAKACNLIAEVCEPGSVLDRSLEIANQLAQLSPGALSLAKEAICQSDKKGRDDEFERSLYYYAFGTSHKREGISAFLEKRAPNWHQESRSDH